MIEIGIERAENNQLDVMSPWTTDYPLLSYLKEPNKGNKDVCYMP